MDRLLAEAPAAPSRRPCPKMRSAPPLLRDGRRRTRARVLVSGGLTPRGGAGRAGIRLRLRGQQPLALHLLADQLAGPADRLGALAGLLLGRLLVVAAELHLAEDALALELLLQRAQRLVDVVVTDKNLHALPRLRCGCGHDDGSAKARLPAVGGSVTRTGLGCPHRRGATLGLTGRPGKPL